MQKILNIESSVEATNWAIILEENYIPYVIRPLKDSVYGGALSLHKPYAELLADSKFKDQIVALRKNVVLTDATEIDTKKGFTLRQGLLLLIVLLLVTMIFVFQIRTS